jgi:hypothetical protein
MMPPRRRGHLLSDLVTQVILGDTALLYTPYTGARIQRQEETVSPSLTAVTGAVFGFYHRSRLLCFGPHSSG